MHTPKALVAVHIAARRPFMDASQRGPRPRTATTLLPHCARSNESEYVNDVRAAGGETCCTAASGRIECPPVKRRLGCPPLPAAGNGLTPHLGCDQNAGRQWFFVLRAVAKPPRSAPQRCGLTCAGKRRPSF